jgi:hypothetical protein
VKAFAVGSGHELEALGDFADAVAELANLEKLRVTGYGALWAPETFHPFHLESMRSKIVVDLVKTEQIRTLPKSIRPLRVKQGQYQHVRQFDKKKG